MAVSAAAMPNPRMLLEDALDPPSPILQSRVGFALQGVLLLQGQQPSLLQVLHFSLPPYVSPFLM